jgi:hypothetical protein
MKNVPGYLAYCIGLALFLRVCWYGWNLCFFTTFLGQVVGFIDNCIYFSPSYIDSAFSSDLFYELEVFTVTKCREIFVDVHVATGVPDEGIRDMRWNSDSYSWLMWFITQEDFTWRVIFIFTHSGPFVYISFWRRVDQSYQS